LVSFSVPLYLFGLKFIPNIDQNSDLIKDDLFLVGSGISKRIDPNESSGPEFTTEF